VETIAQVRSLTNILRSSPIDGFALERENDYIGQPKGSGYRSHHLVFRYESAIPEHRAVNGLCGGRTDRDSQAAFLGT
jgi:ppGpp synthetase/RelA/SpoT-type nucleotidyltranferase